jgi:hypothetical protein
MRARNGDRRQVATNFTQPKINKNGLASTKTTHTTDNKVTTGHQASVGFGWTVTSATIVLIEIGTAHQVGPIARTRQ